MSIHGFRQITFAIACFMILDSSAGAESKRGRWTIMGVVVDSSGKPAAGVKVKAAPAQAIFVESDQPAMTNRQGVYEIRLKPGARFCPALMATSANGTEMGWQPHVLYEEYELKELKLEPVRETEVRVLDVNGDPVTGANVVPCHGAFALHKVATDNSGFAKLRLPEGLDIHRVLAIADDQGFGYVENIDSWPVPVVDQLPDALSIRLEQGSDVEVRITNNQGVPIEGIELIPGRIKLNDRLTDSGWLNQHGTSTDPSGVARFGWIPDSFVGSIRFAAQTELFYLPNDAVLRSGETSVTVTAYRTGTIQGRVTKPDGTPAANVMLQGEGRGQGRYYRASVMTDSDGRYELRPYPDQSLAVAVVDDRWAAETKTELRLREGQVIENADFQLIRGTLITGTMTVGEEKQPLQDRNATLIQDPEGAKLVRWAYTNAAGRYSFRVGPGEYQLSLPLVEGNRAVSIANQDEVTIDGHAERLDRLMFHGSIVDSDGVHAVGVDVESGFTDRGGRSTFKARSDSSGEFRAERWTEAMLLVALDHEAVETGVCYVDRDDEQATLELVPATSLKGRLVDPQGKGMTEIDVNVDLQLTYQGKSATIGLTARTDKDGRFNVPVVPRECRGTLRVLDYATRSVGLADFKSDDDSTTSLGDVIIRMESLLFIFYHTFFATTVAP